MMVTPFHAGDVLIVIPADRDDPEAMRHRGELCIFVRYSTSGHAVVRFPQNARVTHFRTQDLSLKAMATNQMSFDGMP